VRISPFVHLPVLPRADGGSTVQFAAYGSARKSIDQGGLASEASEQVETITRPIVKIHVRIGCLLRGDIVIPIITESLQIYSL
jgi:hypothetical protein